MLIRETGESVQRKRDFTHFSTATTQHIMQTDRWRSSFPLNHRISINSLRVEIAIASRSGTAFIPDSSLVTHRTSVFRSQSFPRVTRRCFKDWLFLLLSSVVEACVCKRQICVTHEENVRFCVLVVRFYHSCWACVYMERK